MAKLKDYTEFMPLGTKVKVTSHRHPDVVPGTTGLVSGHYEGGFAVTITGLWQIAGSDRGATYTGTETCWYPPEEIVHAVNGE
jgi:hypothetical protein